MTVGSKANQNEVLETKITEITRPMRHEKDGKTAFKGKMVCVPVVIDEEEHTASTDHE